MPQADWRKLYPFAAHFAEFGGARMHYLDEGAFGNPPILAVHGNPTWSFYWRAIALGLRDTHRVVVPDHIGCGLSDKPASYRYTLSQHIENLVSLVDRLNLRNITLVAHDWGGAIGLGALLARQDRFSRICLLNTGAFPPPFIPFRIRICRTPGLGKLAVQGMNGFARAALSMAVEKPANMTPEVRAGLLAPYDTWANRQAIYRFVEDIPLTRRHPTYAVLEKIEQDLRALPKIPVQLIWGMKDWCFRPSCLERFEQIFPHAEVHRLNDVGHYVMEDAPERVVPLLKNFVQR